MELLFFFLAVLGLRCYVNFSLVLESSGYSLVAVHQLLIGWASLIVEHRLLGMLALVVTDPWLESTGSVVEAHELNCPKACGIFPDQESNPCLLNWQADSLPLSHSVILFYCLLNVLHFCFLHLNL